MSQYKASTEGPTQDEMELIGIELSVQLYQGRDIELEMHGIKRTIPYRYGDPSRVRITVHTSDGDITMTGPLRPGNYQAY